MNELDPEPLERFKRKLRVPAVGAAVSGPDGIRRAVIGTTERGGDTPALVDHAWHLGSCTKPLTAALYGRLVEQGRAGWEASVADLLPDLTIHPAWAERTVTELLWCRAGVAANFPLRQFGRWSKDTRPLPDQRSAASAQALEATPSKPGRFRYSNLSYIVVGAIIDRLGQTWEDALRTELLVPAGIDVVDENIEDDAGDEVGFGPPRPILGHGPRLQLGSLVVGRGPARHPDKTRADNPAVMSSAGTLHLTLDAWARTMRMFHADHPGPLSADTVTRLLTEPDGPGRGMAMGWRSDPDGRAGVQGTNTLWSATALHAADRSQTAGGEQRRPVPSADGQSRPCRRAAGRLSRPARRTTGR